MKTFLPLFICLLFFLGSCTETIEIEKLIYDTVYLDKVQKVAESVVVIKDTTVIRDTVKVNVAIHNTDTVYQVVTRDSVIIKEVQVIERDTVILIQHDTVTQTVHDTVTVYDRTVVYFDTLYMPGYTRPTWDVPLDLMPHLEEFYSEAQARGINPGSGMLIIQYTDNLPGEGWVSSSFQMNENDQWVIFLDQRLPAELHRASILRELGRLSLNKKYTTDTAKIMCPLFSPERIITTNDINELFR